LKSHRLARQSLGKVVVGSGPKFVEVVHGGMYTVYISGGEGKRCHFAFLAGSKAKERYLS